MYFLLAFSVLLISSPANGDKLDSEIDYNKEKGFNTTKHPKEYFLTPLPLSTIRSIAYPIRQPNPFSINQRPNMKPDIAYTKAYLHPKASNQTEGFIQFRQISDMWMTEIKGVLEGLEANSSYLIVVHENPSTKVGNKLCENLGQPFHYSPLQLNFQDIRIRHALGDLGIVTSDRNGVAAVNLNSVYTSLFGGPGAIIGRSLAIYKIKGEEVILSPVQCGDIKIPKYSPAHFQDDSNALSIRKLNNKNGNFSSKSTTSTTTTPVPNFDKPPNN